MNKKSIMIISLIGLLILILFVRNKCKGAGELVYNEPIEGLVIDEATAIKIAESISIPIFGKNFKDYKPLHAELINDSVWHVYGLPKKSWLSIQLGGAPEYEIQKKDGKILEVYLSR